MTEAIELIKQKFNQYDTVLKEIGLQLCDLQQKNVILKARLEKLEKQHLIGSQHTKRDEI